MPFSDFIRRSRAAVIGALLITGSAQAGVPAVLDIVPEQPSAFIIATDSLTALDNTLRDTSASIESAPYPGLSALLTTMGLRAGIDFAGSAAVLWWPPSAEAPGRQDADAQPTGQLVVIAPSDDPKAFFDAVKAQPVEGLYTFEYSGEQYAAKPFAGTHLAIGDPERVRALEPARGRITELRKALGTLALQTLESADIVALGDAAAINGLIPPDAAPPEGKLPAPPTINSFTLNTFSTLLRSETRSIVGGVKMEPLALRFDIVAGFVADGVLAHASKDAIGEPAAPALNLLPRQPYALAVGIDTAHPFVRVLSDELSPPGRSEGAIVEAELAVLRAVESMDAAAFAVYQPSNLFIGQLSRSMIAWRSARPEDGVALTRAWIERLPALPPPPGAKETFQTTYKEIRNGSDSSVSSSSWTIKPPAGAWSWSNLISGPQPFIEGKTIAAPGQAAMITWTSDAALVEAARERLRGGGTPLASDQLLAQVRELLPPRRAIEFFIDLGPIVRIATPMLGGPGALADMPEELPPVAGGLTAADGSARLTGIIPMPLLKVIFDLSRSLQDVAEEPPQSR